MGLKPCLDCGRPSPNTRCPEHTDARRRAHNARVRPHRERRPDYTHAEAARRREAVEAHRAVHGDWCPGWGYRPAHYVIAPNKLSADHVIAVGSGGSEGGALGVKCLECNGAKGAKAEA